MSPHQARKIIDALAGGADPETGEILPEGSLLQRPAVIRALFVASRALAAIDGTGSNPKSGEPSHAGKPWSAEEDERLLAAFDAGANVTELAESHDRSKGGIASRLVRLGRIKERAEVYVRGSA